jgi:hypothetical protein
MSRREAHRFDERNDHMTEVNKHRSIPSELNHPVTHNSGGKTSTPAGGEVSRGQYQQPRDSRQGFDAPKGDGK